VRGEYEDLRNPYEVVAADMRAKIMSREWQPGGDLPSTERLCEIFEVGSPTIQRALAELKREGWIIGYRGKGRQVRPNQIQVITAGTYFDPAETGFSYDLLEVKRTVPVGDVGEIFATSGDEAVLRHRVMRDQTGPVEVEWSYYPAQIAEGTRIAEDRKTPRGGVPRILAELGYLERRSSDEVTTRDATGYEARLLLLPPGVPVLRILRTTFSDDDRLIEVSVLVKAGHLLAQRYTLL
jgi:GntR family transcriptional regulator